MLAYIDPNVVTQTVQSVAPWLAAVLGAASTALLMGWRWVRLLMHVIYETLFQRPLRCVQRTMPGMISRREAMMLIGGAVAGVMGMGWFRRHGIKPADKKSDAAIGSIPAVTGRAVATPTSVSRANRKLLLLGMDGLDPDLTQALMDAGRMPTFARFAAEGQFQPLATVAPAASPVVWSSFSTGLMPAGHAIFDFIHRRPADYRLDLSMTKSATDGRYVNPRQGQTFWQQLNRAGVKVHALFPPCSFPPEEVEGIVHSGMGVPDLKGHMGRYTLVSSDPSWADRQISGLLIDVSTDNGEASFELLGPRVSGFTGSRDLASRVTLRRGPDGRWQLELEDRRIPLAPQRWSDWVEVTYRRPFGDPIHGICRFYLIADTPHLSLYCTPVQFHPAQPAAPISHPESYAAHLAEQIGLYATLGLPTDTKAYEDGVLDAEGFLAMAASIVDEQQRIVRHALSDWDRGMFFAYFNTPDPIQHMFWQDHLKARLLEQGADALPSPIVRFYEKMDAVLAESLHYIADQPETQVVVVSDHGFEDFREAVEVNRVLAELGYLTLKKQREDSPPLFAAVDWSRTQAYACGFTSIYLNLRGREGQGQVPAEARRAVLKAIRTDLLAYQDTQNGQHPFEQVLLAEEAYGGLTTDEGPDLVLGCRVGYRVSWVTALGGVGKTAIEPNTKRWRGDHLINPAAVPGILLARHADAALPGNIQGMADYALTHYGIEASSATVERGHG